MRSMTSGVEHASTMELVEAAGSIAAELAGRDAPEPGMAALEAAEALGRAMDVMEAALARLVGRVDDTGAFGELGFSSTCAWLRNRLGLRDGRAAEQVRLARKLPRLSQVAKRLSEGSLSAGHASAIADAVARLDDIDAELGEGLLLDLVEQGHTAGQVAKDGAQITDLINQHRGKEKEPEDSKRGFSRSWLTKAKSLDSGLWVKGWLTPEHAAAFEQIIGPLAKPKARGDDRDLGQRTADALMSVLSEGNKGAGVTVIIDLALFTEATGDTGPFDFTARTGGVTGDPNRDDGGSGHPDGANCSSETDPATDIRPDQASGRDHGESPRAAADGSAAEDRWAGHPSAPARLDHLGGESTDDLADDLADDFTGDRTEMYDLDGMWGDSDGHEPGEATGTDATSADLPDGRDEPDDNVTGPDDAPGAPGDPPHGRADPEHEPGDPPHRTGDMSHRPPSPERRRNDHEFDGAAGDRAHIATGHEHDLMCASVHAHRHGRVAARLLDGTPISPERARQIALNAGINVLILGRSGLPLYLGRTVRFATPGQRKAILALYDTCCVQGCQIPAHLSEIHHLDGGWKLATPTDIDKLAPACAWHNRWVETHPDQVKQGRDGRGRAVLRILAPWERRTPGAA